MSLALDRFVFYMTSLHIWLPKGTKLYVGAIYWFSHDRILAQKLAPLACACSEQLTWHGATSHGRDSLGHRDGHYLGTELPITVSAVCETLTSSILPIVTGTGTVVNTVTATISPTQNDVPTLFNHGHHTRDPDGCLV